MAASTQPTSRTIDLPWDKALVSFHHGSGFGAMEFSPFIYPPTTESLAEVRGIISASTGVPVSSIVTFGWYQMARSAASDVT